MQGQRAEIKEQGSVGINPTNSLRVVGLVLKDPVSGQPVFVARGVVELTN